MVAEIIIAAGGEGEDADGSVVGDDSRGTVECGAAGDLFSAAFDDEAIGLATAAGILELSGC
jgi:hypothetical protein